MMSPAGRRKVRKRKAQAENSRMKLTAFAGIMLLAVFLGFITARFVIGPVIGYNADESEIKLAQDSDIESAEKEDEAQTEDKTQDKAANTVPAEGFALQFGAFSTEEAARELSDELKNKGIETEIIEAGDIFKVISPVAENREDVLKALENAKEKEVTDVFIASFQ